MDTRLQSILDKVIARSAPPSALPNAIERMSSADTWKRLQPIEGKP